MKRVMLFLLKRFRFPTPALQYYLLLNEGTWTRSPLIEEPYLLPECVDRNSEVHIGRCCPLVRVVRRLLRDTRDRI